MSEPEDVCESAEELYEGAPCGYLSARPDGTLLRVNRTFLDWTGYERQQLLGGKRLQDLLTVGGKVFYETHVGPLLRMQGAVNEVQLELVCRDGRRLSVLLNTVLQSDASGRPLLLRSTVFDITDRKRYERELLLARQVAEQRARRAALAAEVGRALARRADLPAQLQLCAEALLEHLDAVEVRIWSARSGGAELRLEARAGVVAPGGEGRPLHAPPREARVALERRAVTVQEAAGLAPAEDEDWIRREGVGSCAALPLVAGERLLGVLAVYGRGALDAESEQALASTSNELAIGMDRDWTERELRTAQQRLSTVVRSAPLILFALDAAGRILVSEGKGLQALGIDPAGRLGLSVFDAYAHVPWLLAEFRRALAGESFVGGGELGGLVLETHYTPTLDDRGAVAGVLGVALDMTERTRYEETIRKTIEFEQQLLGIVSHDLRNPLNAILLGASQLLRKGDTLDDGTLRTAARIQSSGERAQRMIRDLLDFTQARLGGGIPIERAPLDLAQLVSQVLEEVEAGHPDRSVSLEVRGEFGGEWDGDRLAQVVTNLVVNALKYSPPGTPVRVALLDHGERVCLEVHNQGPPIPAESMDQLFLPMRRATSGVDRTGRSVGLGLYIVKQIANAHGGDVQVSSDASSGTTFRVMLPRRPGGAG